MDPHVSDPLLQKTSPNQDPAARYPLVTEVSVPVSMSAYHQSSLTIDPVDQLLGLRQGDRSIEDYVQQFCELIDQIPLYDEKLFKSYSVLDSMNQLNHGYSDGRLMSD